ncbi:hypothetical protein ACIFOE_04860 [Paenibacillus sp. NRS-1783]|uniref:hypothetical protein n=1 Tax=Paenibacillus sp. NRS-1783 TaxID=3233907 RepID=UPI003D2B09DA
MLLSDLLRIVHKHADPPRLSGEPIRESAIMFSYGTIDAIKKMVEDIENTFSVQLPSLEMDQIGEQPVLKFIEQIETEIYKYRCR